MLCDLARKYNVDKCPNIISKHKTHSYTPVYNELLKNYRSSFKTVLEIGIGNVQLMNDIVDNYKPGCSLRMWEEYFPNAEIYGCDILTSVLFQENRIRTYYADQSNSHSLDELINNINGGNKIDFIIDDGSHQKTHQKLTFETLWKYVNSGGIYIIEDVNSNNMNFLEQVPDFCDFKDCECIYRHYGEWEGDNFLAFKKKHTT